MWILLLSTLAVDGNVLQYEMFFEKQMNCEKEAIAFVQNKEYASLHPTAKCIFDKTLSGEGVDHWNNK